MIDTKTCVLFGPLRCGNHMMSKFLNLIGLKSVETELPFQDNPEIMLGIPATGHWIHSSHAPWTEESSEIFVRSGLKGLLLVRDPREAAFSYTIYQGYTMANLGKGIREMYQLVTDIGKWGELPNVMTVEYKRMVDAGSQMDAALEILSYLESRLDTQYVKSTLGKIHRTRYTSLTDQYENKTWRDFFKPEHTALCNELFGEKP